MRRLARMLAVTCAGGLTALGSLLAGSRRVHGPSSFGTVRFSAHVDNPWFPLASRARRTSTAASRTARQPRRPHRHRPDEDDRRRHVRRRPGPLNSGAARRADDRLVRAGHRGQRLVLRRGHGRARRERPRHEPRGHLAGGRRRRRPGIFMPAHPTVGQRAAGVLQGPRRGPLPGVGLNARSPCRAGAYTRS